MDVEIVLNQHDGPGVREMDIGQVFQDVSIIDGGVAVGDFDVAPTFERCELACDPDRELDPLCIATLFASGARTPAGAETRDRSLR